MRGSSSTWVKHPEHWVIPSPELASVAWFRSRNSIPSLCQLPICTPLPMTYASKPLGSGPVGRIGNHDVGGKAYEQHNPLPSGLKVPDFYPGGATTTNSGGDYWYKYKGVLFIGINSNAYAGGSDAAHVSYVKDVITRYGGDAKWTDIDGYLTGLFVPRDEALRTWNAGIGLVAIVRSDIRSRRLSTSSVCCPSVGGGSAGRRPDVDHRTGAPGSSSRPAVGWSTRSISRGRSATREGYTSSSTCICLPSRQRSVPITSASGGYAPEES